MSLTVTSIITNAAAFVTPIGCSFRAGERFEVEIVDRSTRCRHLGTGSVVWIQGSTLTAAASSAAQFRPV